uniref:Uncharacterized protein n=1 Tax=Romanomermis culicivorax TaxID=13658 RepID=A0A915L4X6_ROMCU
MHKVVRKVQFTINISNLRLASTTILPKTEAIAWCNFSVQAALKRQCSLCTTINFDRIHQVAFVQRLNVG